jgi:hypothetical protein
MRHFCLTLFLLLSYVFLGHTTAEGLLSLSSLANPAPVTEGNKGAAAASASKTPGPETTPAPAAETSSAEKGAVNLRKELKDDAKENKQGEGGEAAVSPGNDAAAEGTTPPVTTASGAPSLAAEVQADAQTPAEKEAAQKKKDAQQKTKNAQAQKDAANAEKLAADAQLKAAESKSPIDPTEYANAKTAEAKAKKDQEDAENAQKDAAKAQKDAEKASKEAIANGAKLRVAQNEAADAKTDADKKAAEVKRLEGPPSSGNPEELEKAKVESAAANKRAKKANADVNKFTEAGQTPATRADLAKKGLETANAKHDEAQADVFDKEKKLAEAQSQNPPDEEKITDAQNKLKDAKDEEVRTEKEMSEARAKSQKANANLNAELMKTETPEQTRVRLAAAANANLSAAQSAQEDAQTNADNAQTELENAESSGVPPAKVGWLHRKWNVLRLKLSGATAEVASATKTANAANANVDSPVGMAQNKVQQLQAQQQDLESQHQDAASEAEAAGMVIQSKTAPPAEKEAALKAQAAANEKVVELENKMNSNTAAIGEAQAQVTVAQSNEEDYQKALAEKRAAQRDQEKMAAEEAACEKNLNRLKKEGGSEEQKAAAQGALEKAREKSSEAAALLAEKEATFRVAEKRAMGPIQKLRMSLEQNQKTIGELKIKKVKIDQELEEQEALLAQKVNKSDTNTTEIEKNIARLKFESGNTNTAIASLQKSIDEAQAKLSAIDRAVSADVLGHGDEEQGLVDIQKGTAGEIKVVEDGISKGTRRTSLKTPEEEIEEEESDAVSPENLQGPDGPDEVDPLAPDVGTEDERGPQIPTFQRGAYQPVFGPGGGPVANFMSPGGTTPNFNKAAGDFTKFASGSEIVPNFNGSSGDVSFGNSSAPLPWGASSAKAPSFGTNPPVAFGGGGGAPMPIFRSPSQTAFGGASAPTAAATPLSVPGDGLTKIKTATHLAELAPPTVSEEKKQALMRAKEMVTSATESLKAAEKTENLRTITNAQITRDVATLKYEQALNNASPLGVPETESTGWWNKDPSSPYSKYNVDGGGRMDAPLQTSERTEHFVLSDLDTVKPVYTETLPNGAKVLVVENVGFSMKKGNALSTIVKLAQVVAAS